MHIAEDYGIITIHGGFELYIQNFVSILELESDHVRIKAKKELITIEGGNLIIDYMSRDELKISGEIAKLTVTEVAFG